MHTPTLQKIQHYQSEYYQLIRQTKIIDTEKLTFNKIAAFIDEIKYFWLKRLDIIDLELSDLTENHTCFLLTGAIYLNIHNNEHFYFKSLGDYHLLPDPFLKLENFFRVPEDKVNAIKFVELFNNVLLDTLNLLEKYQKFFYILPIRELAIDEELEYQKLIDNFFISFLSSAFGRQFANQDDFCNAYTTFEDIESNLEPQLRDRLIFNDYIDENLSLREKIEIYSESQISCSQLMSGESETKIFLAILYSYVAQVSGILLTCAILHVNPYIRFEVTFHYLLLIMHTFTKEQYLKSLIEKTIIFYVFRRMMDGCFDGHGSFNTYCNKIADMQILTKIIGDLRNQEIDINHGGITELREIMETTCKAISPALDICS